MPRMSSGFRGRGRRKRAFFWMGNQFQQTVSNTTVAFDMYDPISAVLEDSKSLRLEHVVLWMSFISNTAELSQIGFAIQVSPTNLALAATNILDPLSNDVDYFNKKQIVWGGAVSAPDTNNTPLLVYERVRAKRRIDAAQDVVSLTFRAGSATNTCVVTCWFRALFSKPA